jgi:hypothetical protein
MKRVFAALAAFSALIALPALAASDRGYDNGPVWDVGAIQTKDGHFDDYMKFVTTDWKTQQEALKKAGYILDYKVYVVADPRDNEPDIYLATKFKNMAAFDTSLDEMDAFFANHMGPRDQTNKEQQDRGAIRTVRGDQLMRELILK